MIKDVKSEYLYQVTTDEKEYNQYIRRGPESWYVCMGESVEPLYDCEEIEKEFMAYMGNACTPTFSSCKKLIDRFEEEYNKANE